MTKFSFRWLAIFALLTVSSTVLFAKADNEKTIFPIISYLLADKVAPEVFQLLNDTGIDWAGNSSGNSTDCLSNISSPQDCHQGRDFTHNDDSDGHAGFSYTKISNTGIALPANATSWSCVKDNVTGLMWEVKTDDGIHNKDNTYRWGGKTHLGSDYGIYFDDWNNLVDGSNNESLCSYGNWRIPTIHELENLASRNRVEPAIDTGYFPNTLFSSHFWSASPNANYSDTAWYVRFKIGESNHDPRSSQGYVRLVRGGQ